MGYVISFEDDRATDPILVGHKFASLAIASRSGFSVPQAFAISTKAHRFYLSTNQWPEGLYEEVFKTAKHLELSRGISIRSSATREDLEGQSFAGQYQSFLKVFTEDDLLSKIERCWNSAQNEVVSSYLEALNNNCDDSKVPLMCVVLQKMVRAVAAGIAFGCNPMDPTKDEIIIEAVEGLADQLASGQVSPYRATTRGSGKFYFASPKGEVTKPIESTANPLRNDQWESIAKLLRSLEEKMFQGPLDVEWAIDEKDQLWVLQSRMITTVDKESIIAPAGIWSRKIADDLWADRLTPFLASAMLANSPRYDLSHISKIIGLPVTRPTLAVIDGYLYVNCANLKTVTTYIPKLFRTPDLKNLFPVNIDVDSIETVSWFRRLQVITRCLLLPFSQPNAIPIVCLMRAGKIKKEIEYHLTRIENLPEDTPDQTFKKALYAVEIMALFQERNQWPYSHATLFTWVFRWLIEDRAKMSHSYFLILLSKKGYNISIEIERAFRVLVKKICSDKTLAHQILNWTASDCLEDLPMDFHNSLKLFLKQYGCRSRHRTLYVKRWAESPEEVIGILQSLVRHKISGRSKKEASGLHPYKSPFLTTKPNTMEKKRLRGHGFREQIILWFWAALANGFILKLTRRFLDLREDLRFLLDKSLYQIRFSLLKLGAQLGLGELALFLDMSELRQVVEGRMPLVDARRISSKRLESFLKSTDIPAFYVDGQPVEVFDCNGGIIYGIGTSPGRVTGRARIVENPAKTYIQQGDIVVARNTDPGWTPILSSVGGMVMEEGGLLNHCSIVARELGVPSIVGVSRATQTIPDGSLITIDGGLGVIQIED